MRYFASLLVRYENAVASHSLEFAAQNAMRYRLSAKLYQSPGRSDVSQLVVPADLRKAVLGLAHESIMSGHEG